MCRLPWHTVRVDSPVDSQIIAPEVIISHADWDAYLARYPLNKAEDMPSYHCARKQAYHHTFFRATIDTSEQIFYRQFTGPMFAPGQGMKTANEVARQAKYLSVKVKLFEHQTERALLGVTRVVKMCKGAKVVEIELEFDLGNEWRARMIQSEVVKATKSGLWEGIRVYVRLTGREGLYDDWNEWD